MPLIGYLQQPRETLDMQRVVDLISHDNSLAAQCLHMANSPLVGRWQSISTTRGAVIALGLQRMREIAMSCCVLNLLPERSGEVSPVALWEHSLACAFVCRRIAKRVGMDDPEQAYFAGLLHDIGFVVNLHILPVEYGHVMRTASTLRSSMENIEQEQLGFTHCESGQLLAQKWNLAPVVTEVIAHHHCLSAVTDSRPLIALVNLADRLCRARGLGYGYEEDVTLDWKKDDAIGIIRETWAAATIMDWPRYSAEMDSYLGDVRKLVSVLYRLKGA